jgi:hypothetical protein
MSGTRHGDSLASQLFNPPGTETPDEPCTAIFQDVEWKGLYCWVNKTTHLPKKPLTIREAVFMAASKGGHMGRKCDGFPGALTTWRGMEKLFVFVEAYALLTHQPYSNPLYSGP